MAARRPRHQDYGQLRSGAQVGRWTVVVGKELGSGGNGRVWPVMSEDGTEGALKVLRDKAPAGERFRRFVREVQAQSELTAENVKGVLPLLDYNLPNSSSDEVDTWLVTPLAVTLPNFIQSNDVKPLEIVAMFAEVADTLHRLAERGMSHRDIKPDNIFHYRGDWVLGDFGLIDLPNAAPITVNSRKVGPVNYIAPEMLLAPAEAIGPPADIYSLAKTLWVTLTGYRFPPPGQQRCDYLPFTTQSLLPGLPRAKYIDLLIEKSTAPDPSVRPSASEFAAELRTCLGGSMNSDSTPDLKTAAGRIRRLQEPYLRVAQSREQVLQLIRQASTAMENGMERFAGKVVGALGGASYAGPGPMLDLFVSNEVRLSGLQDMRTKCLVIPGDYLPLRVWSGYAMYTTSDERICVHVGHVLGSTEVQNWQGAEILWHDEALGVLGSAVMTYAYQGLIDQLIMNLPMALDQLTRRLSSLE